jgi:hypothetical protein
MDGNMLEFKTEFESRDPHFWNRFTRMLIHAWVGLYRLHQSGYSFGHVSAANLMFKLQFDDTDNTAGLMGVKWRCPRGMSTEPARQHEDWIEFAKMVCVLRYGKIDKQSIDDLRHDNHMLPLSHVAYEILTKQQISAKALYNRLQEHMISKETLDPIPVYENW